MRYHQLSAAVLDQGGRLFVSNAAERGLRVQVRKRVDSAERVFAEAFTGPRGTLDDAAGVCAVQLEGRTL